jgi:hypothetical protein
LIEYNFKENVRVDETLHFSPILQPETLCCNSTRVNESRKPWSAPAQLKVGFRSRLLLFSAERLDEVIYLFAEFRRQVFDSFFNTFHCFLPVSRDMGLTLQRSFG